MNIDGGAIIGTGENIRLTIRSNALGIDSTNNEILDEFPDKETERLMPT
jgi:hypothetical protein